MTEPLGSGSVEPCLSESLAAEWETPTGSTHLIIYKPTQKVFKGANAQQDAAQYVTSGDLSRDEATAAMEELARLRSPYHLREGWEVTVTYSLKRGKIQKNVSYCLSVGSGLAGYVLQFESAKEAAEMDRMGMHPEAAADTREYNQTVKEVKQLLSKLITSVAEGWSQLKKATLQKGVRS